MSRAGTRCTTCCAPTPPIRPATPTASPSAQPRSAGCWTTTCTPPHGAASCCTRPGAGRAAPPRPGTAPEQFTGHEQALAWFEAEYHVLLAAVNVAADWGFDSHAWQLSWAMTPFLHARGHRQEWARSSA